MKIATSPFIYKGVLIFTPKKLGNLQAKEEHTHTRLGVYYIKRDYIFFTLLINVGII